MKPFTASPSAYLKMWMRLLCLSLLVSVSFSATLQPPTVRDTSSTLGGPAHEVLCVGTSKDTLSTGEKYVLMAELDRNIARDVKREHGVRWMWNARRNWSNRREGVDHCTKACLIPAATWGFDAAICQLRKKMVTSKWHFHISVGYLGPHEPYKREKPNSPWLEGDIMYMLRPLQHTRVEDVDKRLFWYKDEEHLGIDTWQDWYRRETLPKYNPSSEISEQGYGVNLNITVTPELS